MEKVAEMTYEQKEKRLDEILRKLDSSETPIDQLASEAKEAATLITAMYATLKGAKQELATVFEELETYRSNTQTSA